MTKIAHKPRNNILEPLLLYLITISITVGLNSLQSYVSWIGSYVLVIVAATFLYLPIEFLHRKGLNPADFGIHSKQTWSNLRLAVLVMAISFPPYLVGFHFWQTGWLGQRLAVAEARFDRWPVELQADVTAPPLREGEVRLTDHDDRFTLNWHLSPGQRLRATITSDVDLIPYSDGNAVQGDAGEFVVVGLSDGRARFRVPGSFLGLDIEAGGDRLPADRLRLGSGRVAADDMPFRAERGLGWLLNLILVQLLLVALPEEVFYRGYLQTRLDGLLGPTSSLLGARIRPWSIVATSALFAVGHFLVIPHPQRLAVFFPSLLFGWMRCATGSVTAAVLFHASCNILVEIAARLYAG